MRRNQQQRHGINGVAITNSYATSSSATVPTITGVTIHNCYAFNPSGPGISATDTVEDSAAYCGNGSGGINVISAHNVSDCYAEVVAGDNATGIRADVIKGSTVKFGATGSYGIVSTALVQNSIVLLTATDTNLVRDRRKR